MKTAMTEITFDGLTGEGMTWSADGEPAKAPKAMKIVDGAYTAMECELHDSCGLIAD